MINKMSYLQTFEERIIERMKIRIICTLNINKCTADDIYPIESRAKCVNNVN